MRLNRHPVPQQAVFEARAEIDGIFVSDLAQQYMVDVIYATRFPNRYGEPLSDWVQIGASPRGSLALDRCARVRAWLDGHEFVTPDHVRAVMHDCLRHRLILSYEAISQGVTAGRPAVGSLPARLNPIATAAAACHPGRPIAR